MPSIDLVPIQSGWIARICQGDPELHHHWIELAWGETKEIAVSTARQNLKKLMEFCCEN